MKKFLILATLLALLCLGTVPALAHAQESAAAPQAPLKVFALTGKITAVDPAARTVTVKVWSGNWLARPHQGGTLTLKATDYTRFFEKQEDCSIVPASFDDLEVGQRSAPAAGWWAMPGGCGASRSARLSAAASKALLLIPGWPIENVQPKRYEDGG